MVGCHFYPFFEKKITCGIVSSGIQSMVNDAFDNDAFDFKALCFILKLCV